MPPENYEGMKIEFVKIEKETRLSLKNIIKIIAYFSIGLLSLLTVFRMLLSIRAAKELGYIDIIFFYSFAALCCAYVYVLCISKIHILTKEKAVYKNIGGIKDIE